MDPDFLLIQKMKMGEDSAIEAFVRKYYQKICKYCYLHIHDYGYAEDLTQETFEKFFRSLMKYQHYGKALNYLYVIAANCCRDFCKKNRALFLEDLQIQGIGAVQEIREAQYVQNIQDAQSAQAATDSLDDRIAVELAFAKLPAELKETAVLFFFQELRQKEIARILGISLPLVKYRIRKSRELLASYLTLEVRGSS